jgi:hypothetical protein
MYKFPNNRSPPPAPQSHRLSGGYPNQRRDTTPYWDRNPSFRRTYFKHISFNQQFPAQQLLGDPDSVAAWQCASANCAELLLGVAGTGRKIFFNFKLKMFHFAYQNMGNNFPYPQKWVLFFCASRQKQSLHLTNKQALFLLLIALPGYIHFLAHRIYPFAGVALQNKFTFFLLQS